MILTASLIDSVIAGFSQADGSAVTVPTVVIELPVVPAPPVAAVFAEASVAADAQANPVDVPKINSITAAKQIPLLIMSFPSFILLLHAAFHHILNILNIYCLHVTIIFTTVQL